VVFFPGGSPFSSDRRFIEPGGHLWVEEDVIYTHSLFFVASKNPVNETEITELAECSPDLAVFVVFHFL